MSIGDILNRAEKAQSDKTMREKRQKLEAQRKAENNRHCYQLLDDNLKQIQHDFKDFIGVRLTPYESYERTNGFKVMKTYTTFNPEYTEGKYGSKKRFYHKETKSFCGNITFDNEKYWGRSNFRVQIQVDEEDHSVKFIYTTKFYGFKDAEEWLNIAEDRVWTNDPIREYSLNMYTYDSFKEHLLDFLTEIVDIDSFKKKHGIFTEEVEKVTRIG